MYLYKLEVWKHQGKLRNILCKAEALFIVVFVQKLLFSKLTKDNRDITISFKGDIINYDTLRSNKDAIYLFFLGVGGYFETKSSLTTQVLELQCCATLPD